MLDEAPGVGQRVSECVKTTPERLRDNFDRSRNNDVVRRLSRVDVLNYASKIWKGQESIARAIASETIRIVGEAHEKAPSFFWGESGKWVFGGVFYLLGRRMKVARSQKQIARSLDTNEMTIRDSYRKWLEHFPEFWPEATAHPKESSSERSKPPSHPRSKRIAKFL
jgi:hypothetical protein